MLKQKYKIGISGHRDLKSSQIPKYEKEIRDILTKKIEEYPNREIYILTPLAEGADQLVAIVAKELGLRYEVVLPMPLELYKKDFTPKSYEAFYRLYIDATGSQVIPLDNDTTLEEISDYGAKRDRQYLKVGQEVVNRSDFMIFLWDRVVNHKTGGTADIFEYAKSRYQESFNQKHSVIETQRESS